MTPGFVVAFGGVLLIGVIGSVVIALSRRSQRRERGVHAGARQAEIEERLARAEAEIAEVRSLIAR